MADDEYEPNRVLGMPWTKEPRTRQGETKKARTRQGEEPQRVMGFPVDWFGAVFGAVDLGWLRSLAHPVRGYRRRRRLGPHATDDHEPRPLRLAAHFLTVARGE